MMRCFPFPPFHLIAAVALAVSPLAAATSQDTQDKPADRTALRQFLSRGWNTWNSRNVLSHVLLPEGFGFELQFKQRAWLDEHYLDRGLIGRSGDGVERIRPGLHALDGSYTELTLEWESLQLRIETGVVEDELVALLTPLDGSGPNVSLIVVSAIHWNGAGALSKTASGLAAKLPSKTVSLYFTEAETPDPHIPSTTPYRAMGIERPIGISTSQALSVPTIRQRLDEQRRRLADRATRLSSQSRTDTTDLKDAYLAIQATLGWNLVYDPRQKRVVSTVGRLWNEEYGGLALFGWDNFFLAYLSSLYNRELALSNALEHLDGLTEEGFIPNDNRGNGSKSWDRSQPPVGAIMIKEIYRRYPEKWFLEAAFDPLLSWNRWWFRKRMNGSLLSYGSHPAKNPFGEPNVATMVTAGYESGMDDSPMYQDVSFDSATHTMALHDVGLNSLHLADTKALIEIALLIGRADALTELSERQRHLEVSMESLWNSELGLYLNRHTRSGQAGEFSRRLSPTLFYPLLAELPDAKKAERMVREHLDNPKEFGGEFVIPSIARSDPEFAKQRYWKGAIWPPLNFLTYLGLRRYGFKAAHQTLSEKSLALFVREWRRKGYVSENYSAITGTGDDESIDSDRFHSWGALFGILAFIEAGLLAPPEASLAR